MQKWTNVTGSADQKHEDAPSWAGSWLKFWKIKNKARKDPKCCACQCPNQAVHGAHVRKINKNGNEYGQWYIIPTCSRHNPSRKKIVFCGTKKAKPVPATDKEKPSWLK